MLVVLRTLYTILDLTGQQLHARMHAIILSLVLYASVERDANNLAYLPTNRIFTDKMVTASMINCIWSISNGLPSSAGVEIFNLKLWQPGSSATYLPTSRSVNKLFKFPFHTHSFIQIRHLHERVIPQILVRWSHAVLPMLGPRLIKFKNNLFLIYMQILSQVVTESRCKTRCNTTKVKYR
jgi:hypothetical protein